MWASRTSDACLSARSVLNELCAVVSDVVEVASLVPPILSSMERNLACFLSNELGLARWVADTGAAES